MFSQSPGLRFSATLPHGAARRFGSVALTGHSHLRLATEIKILNFNNS